MDLTLPTVLLSAFTLLAVSAAQDGGGAASGVDVELWCVAKNNAADPALQAALNWACGQGGSDCSAIQQGGPCYDGSDLQKTASFAFNDYFLKHGMTEESCNFSNTAAFTSLNPSFGRCRFPSSKGAAGNGNFIGSSTGQPMEDLNSSATRRKGWMWSLVMIIYLLHAAITRYL